MLIVDKSKLFEFLKECHREIQRISNTYMTKSEKQDREKLCEPYPNKWLEVSRGDLIITNHAEGKNIPSCLPEKLTPIDYKTELLNLKRQKLYFLVELYNDVAQYILNKEMSVFNLHGIFLSVKRKTDSTFKEYVNKSTDTNLIMKTQRRHILRKFPGSMIGFFQPPSSKSFLNKYGFFDLDSNKNSSLVWLDNKTSPVVSYRPVDW